MSGVYGFSFGLPSPSSWPVEVHGIFHIRNLFVRARTIVVKLPLALRGLSGQECGVFVPSVIGLNDNATWPRGALLVNEGKVCQIVSNE